MLARFDWYNSKSLLKDTVRDSNNFSQVLSKLGLTTSGGNVATLKKYLIFFKISTNHFINVYSKKKVSLERFTDDCQYSAAFKRYIIKNNLIEYKCSECGISTWNNKELSLELDHINGNKRDNRLENLRFLCPNCHSQTSTFAGKNQKKKFSSLARQKQKDKEKDIKEKDKFNLRLNRINLVIISSIDFSRRGWPSKLAALLKLSPQYSVRWMKKNMKEFYNNNCYKL